jgi:hypothetical protein
MAAMKYLRWIGLLLSLVGVGFVVVQLGGRGETLAGAAALANRDSFGRTLFAR